jgi:glycosyltransferase involved in cell wall biosynthesis
MLVSIIVPIYNVEKYLNKCIDSLIKQTYNKIEILLVNDGSKDNSNIIMEEYAKQDKRVKCFYKNNGGLSDARNYGLKNSNGEYVMFIDSDDYIALNAVELLVNSIKENSSEIAVCDMSYVYDDHQTYTSGGNFDTLSFNDNHEVIFINNSACNKLFKISLFDDIKFPTGLWYEDLACIPIVLSKAKKVSKINEALYFYVQRGDSIAHTISNKIFDIYQAIKMISDYYDNHQLDKEINKLYIEHGLFLTTLRIKDSGDEVIKYWEMNLEKLDQYYPAWRNIKKFDNYSFKQNIIFKLLQKNKLNLVYKIYNKG